MLAIMSPARNIRPASFAGIKIDMPIFQKEAMQLIDALKNYSPWELEGLLDLNPQRAFEIFKCYQFFDSAAPGTPALSSYYGAAFRNLNIQDFDIDDFIFAQEHLRILSALYGLLCPADSILPHRLGMNRDFKINGQDLYGFWGNRLYKELYQTHEVIVNLASAEYFRLITPYLRPWDILINCRFLVQKPGSKPRGTVSTVRAARGQMVRYIIKNRITEPDGIKDFDWEGYRFIDSRSDDFNYVFIQNRMYM